MLLSCVPQNASLRTSSTRTHSSPSLCTFLILFSALNLVLHNLEDCMSMRSPILTGIRSWLCYFGSEPTSFWVGCTLLRLPKRFSTYNPFVMLLCNCTCFIQEWVGGGWYLWLVLFNHLFGVSNGRLYNYIDGSWRRLKSLNMRRAPELKSVKKDVVHVAD